MQCSLVEYKYFCERINVSPSLCVQIGAIYETKIIIIIMWKFFECKVQEIPMELLVTFYDYAVFFFYWNVLWYC